MLTFATLGKNFCMRRPKPKNIVIEANDPKMLCNGTVVVVPSKIFRPKVKSHNGIITDNRLIIG